MSGRAIVRIKGLRSIWNIKENIWRGRKKKVAATSYDTILCYSRANSIYTEKGLHFGCNMYAHGWNLYNADLRNTSYDGYTSWSGSIPIIIKIQANSDGTITWWSSSITVRNGGITSAPSS